MPRQLYGSVFEKSIVGETMADEEKNSEETQEESDQESLEEEQKQLEELLKAIRQVEENKQKNKKPTKKSRRMIAIEFGTMFHTNPLLNFMAYYSLNLLVIYTVVTLFNFGSFRDLSTVLLFVLAYTMIELVFRTYILLNHFKFVLRTFGFIFYFGYVTIFFLIEQYLFPRSVVFFDASLLLVFVGMFIVFRYLITQISRRARSFN